MDAGRLPAPLVTEREERRGGDHRDVGGERVARRGPGAQTAVERTRNAPWGLEGGGSGRANDAAIIDPDGGVAARPKATRLPAVRGALIRLQTGGGGGYGDPAKRAVEAVKRDLEEGYVSEEFARRHYPQAFGG